MNSVVISSKSIPEDLLHVGEMRSFSVGGIAGFDARKLAESTVLARVFGGGNDDDGDDVGGDLLKQREALLESLATSDGFDGQPIGVVATSTIDPVFQVDLHALTAGDGVYFSIARAAVQIHEGLTALLYLPIR